MTDTTTNKKYATKRISYFSYRVHIIPHTSIDVNPYFFLVFSTQNSPHPIACTIHGYLPEHLSLKQLNARVRHLKDYNKTRWESCIIAYIIPITFSFQIVNSTAVQTPRRITQAYCGSITEFHCLSLERIMYFTRVVTLSLRPGKVQVWYILKFKGYTYHTDTCV